MSFPALRIPTAKIFQPLLKPARYKGAYGRRGSGKSHFFAEMLVEDCLRISGLRAVCIREVQKSLKDSAKRLIETKLSAYNLGSNVGFKVFRDHIRTPGNGVIIFQGMQDHTAESIKSLEGFSRAWVEEAQTLSQRSLELLRPTIRTIDSELWFSWNPRFKTDPVDRMFRGETPPTGAVVVKANWENNPWFPSPLDQERRDCLAQDPDKYRHIWEEGYAEITEGAYYAQALAKARSERRIGVIAADPLMTLRAVWDIGGTGAKADATAIWIVQYVGREIRFLDHYEAQGQPLSAHLHWLRSHEYGGALCILPHDGAQHDKIAATTYEGALREAGFSVRVIPNQGKGAAMQRIEAARRLFPQMWFDENRCRGGLEALGWYHEKRDEIRGIGLGPEHDWSSHSADAFGLAAIAWEPPVTSRKITYSNKGIF
ncbi:MAG: PBSX family phage terminase large subunit [Zymomonas mobilis]|uniref:Phage terminase large subunit n=1 Tax=Zymomonas mobilis TaxID=542 RepID=A0A542VZW6_ZYMMB|nr:PBSX family phage terminase large subunit [Zymomonas mobilis]TQL16875.1 phage terminase large subunit [Zymomonas mobilis]